MSTAIPEGFKTMEEIAAETGAPYYKVQKAVKELSLAQTVFPEDKRRRYSPENVQKIKQWLQSH